VTHVEFLYLHGLVGITKNATEMAAREGAAFHPARPFVPLASGLEACAWYEDGRTQLRLRHRTTDDASLPAAVAVAFHVFFPEGCERTPPVTKLEWITYQGAA
jgi:hypothetical protein